MLFFLPGRPYLWMFVAVISLTISILRKVVQPKSQFLHAPAVNHSLLFFGAVVLVTALITGGIRLALFGGSQMGGKKYIYILAAIVAYFALSSQKIPTGRAAFYAILFFLSSLTAVISNLAYMAGPGFYFLYLLFPSEIALDQAMAMERSSNHEMVRINGLAIGCLGGVSALLVNDGIQKLFSWRHLGKFTLLIGMIMASLMGGFRSTLIILCLTLVILFFLEGLHRTTLFPKLILAMGLLGILTVPFVRQLPFSMFFPSMSIPWSGKTPRVQPTGGWRCGKSSDPKLKNISFSEKDISSTPKTFTWQTF